MSSTVAQRPDLLLSICVGTFNRAEYIAATLDSIIDQATEECEIVVSDNASTDATEEVVAKCAQRFARLRYSRHPTNQGMDRNFDRAVELAAGKYCWLFADDDLMKSGAIASVLRALRQQPSVVMTNLELRNSSMSISLKAGLLAFDTDRHYKPSELDRLFLDVQKTAWYLSTNIIRRDLWLSRRREPYYGTLFLYVAVIFQAPPPADVIVLAEPLVAFRTSMQNSYSSRMGEILLSTWPTVVASLALSDATRGNVISAQPWTSLRHLFTLRGMGMYTWVECRSWVKPRIDSRPRKVAAAAIALLPGVLVNSVLLAYHLARGNRTLVGALRQSRFCMQRATSPTSPPA